MPTATENEVLTSAEFLKRLDAGRRDFSRTTIQGSLNLYAANIQGSLILYAANIQGSLILYAANIQGDLNLSRATIQGDLILHEADIQGDLNLHEADIQGDLNLSRATIQGELYCESANSFQYYLRLAARREQDPAFQAPPPDHDDDKNITWINKTDPTSLEWFCRLAFWQILYDLQIAIQAHHIGSSQN